MSAAPPPGNPGGDHLAGTVERVTYHNPQNGFAVLRVRVPGRDELLTVVGSVTAVTAGEYVKASGRWTVDRDHGPQFKADHLATAAPESVEGIERYLASGILKGVGPVLAKKIVKVFKGKTLDMLDHRPADLLDIHGIGAKRFGRIKQSWREQQGVREIMLFLHRHGVSSGRAVRIHRTYGDQSLHVLQTNPYQLAQDIRGIGFKTADDLAQKLGLPADSPARLRAALSHALVTLTGEGHVGFPEPGVVEKTVELIGVEGDRLAEPLAEELAAGNIRAEAIDGDRWLFLASYYNAETRLARHVERLRHTAHPLPPEARDPEQIERFLADTEAKVLRLSDGQRAAVRAAAEFPFVIVTGGPGVGKTTLVKTLLNLYDRHGLEVHLAAPTGRAAKRMSEATGRPARTLHRLLEFDPANGGFARTENSPLKGQVFILDETSMVDTMLAFQFLRAVPDGAAVVFVGDVDQLPSVGPGTVLADLLRTNAVPSVTLTQVFRQAGGSRIVEAAHSILQGYVPKPADPGEQTDFYFIRTEEADAVADRVRELVQRRIPDKFGFKGETDIQVLAPMNRGVLGTRNLNLLLQASLNPPKGKAAVERYGWVYRVGDKVIQTENNYDRDVFNGDLGTITAIDEVEQEVTVRVDNREVAYDFGDLDELSLAYALTIHRSQGSEYPCVVVPVHMQHYLLLQRNLLYTAVTRGKRLVIVVGGLRAFQMAAGRQDARKRMTGLPHWLRRLEGKEGWFQGE